MDDEELKEGPPGSQGAGLGGRKESGPRAGSGPGGPEGDDIPPEPLTEGVGRDGPRGPQDSSVGDLEEPG
jgi:hypothetical protein